MNKYKLSILISLLSLCNETTNAQTTKTNYTISENMLASSGNNSVKSIQYYDGLGRPDVLAAGGQNTSGKYVYSLTQYDAMGRESKKWLPSIGGTSPDIISADDVQAKSNATYKDSHAFSANEYDALNRPIFTSTPGDSWVGGNGVSKGKATTYITNTEKSVKKYSLNTSGAPTFTGTYYEAGALTGERKTDEDGHTIDVYKDLFDNVVLERRCDNIDTYYVYDRGLLRAVYCPGGSYYKYKYDAHGRCIEKTLPQCSAIKYWYDKYGRVAFMQDGRMRSAGKYRFYLYDALNRMVVQGMCTGGANSVDSTYAATAVYGSGSKNIDNTSYFTDSRYIITNPKLEIANYYDGYGCLSSAAMSSATSKFGFTNNGNICTTTLLTAQIVTDNNGKRYYRVMHYDDKGRCTEKMETNVNDYLTKTNTYYSFTDKVTRTVTSTYNNTKRLQYQVTDSVEYDVSCDLPVRELLKYNGGTFEEIAHNYYDGLGRIEKSTSNNGQIADTYQYDVHGWLKLHQNYEYRLYYAPFFSEKLYYADGPNSEKCYNGNISAQEYSDANNQGGTKIHKYKYDNMDRLIKSDYSTRNIDSHAPNYSESFEYNQNSSLKSLVRHGYHYRGSNIPIDSLKFRYNGARLEGIDELAGSNYIECSSDFIDGVDEHYEYSYDECGAITMDANKGVYKIWYDFNGNPTGILFNNGSINEYVYTADGVKLKTIHRTAVDGIKITGYPDLYLAERQTLSVDSTLYVGALEIESGDAKKAKCYFSNGYIDIQGETLMSYNYMIKDHLGNVRHVDKAEPDNRGNEIVQVNDYYAYGGVRAGESIGSGIQHHLYNGKEFDNMHGLNLYDYSARQYDATIGQFTSMDPLCEKYYHVSPYAYCNSNPIANVDPDGESPLLWGVAFALYNGVSAYIDGKSEREICAEAFEGFVDGAMFGGFGSAFAGKSVLHAALWGGASSFGTSLVKEAITYDYKYFSWDDCGKALGKAAVDGVFGAISGVGGHYFSGFLDRWAESKCSSIDSYYKSEPVQNMFKSEIQSEMKYAGYAFGHSTKTTINRMTGQRAHDFAEFDKFNVNAGVWAIDKVGGLGIDALGGMGADYVNSWWY